MMQPRTRRVRSAHVPPGLQGAAPPLTVWGVERRLFFLALLMGAATFNLFYSFLAGLLMFGGLYGFAWWATAARPGHAAHPAVLVARPPPLRPGEARPRRTSRCRHGEASAASSATTARPARSTR